MINDVDFAVRRLSSVSMYIEDGEAAGTTGKVWGFESPAIFAICQADNVRISTTLTVWKPHETNHDRCCGGDLL